MLGFRGLAKGRERPEPVPEIGGGRKGGAPVHPTAIKTLISSYRIAREYTPEGGMGKKEDIKALEDKVKQVTRDLDELKKRAKLIKAKLDKKTSEAVELGKRLKQSEHKAEERTRQMKEIKMKLVKLGKQAERAIAERNKQLEELKRHVDEMQFAIVAMGEGVVIPPKTEVYGGIKTEKDIKLGKEAVVRGPVEAGGNVHVDAASRVEGNIVAEGECTIGDSSTVRGNIIGHGSVVLGAECHLDRVHSGGDVTIGKGSVIGGVNADGAVEIADEVEVNGDITYHGSVSIGHQVAVKGTISSSVKPAIIEAEESIEEEMEASVEGGDGKSGLLERRICSICGTVNKSNAKVCVTCDEPLAVKEEEPKGKKKGAKFRLPEPK